MNLIDFGELYQKQTLADIKSSKIILEDKDFLMIEALLKLAESVQILANKRK